MMYLLPIIIIIMQLEVSLEIIKNPKDDNSRIISIQQLVSNIWNLGLITYGGPMSHVGVFRNVFVVQLKTLSQQIFNELLTICQSLPGPTSTQLLIASSIYSTASFLGGLIAFIIFSLPSFIVLFLSALFLNGVKADTNLGTILAGFRIVSVGIILQAFWGLSKKYREDTKYTILFLVSGLIYRFYQTTYTIILLFIGGGIFALVNMANRPSQPQPTIKNRFNNCIFGAKNMVLFVTMLIICLVIGWMHSQNKLVVVFSVFYKIGSIVIGGGHVILPMMWSEFSNYQYFTETDYWNGFSIISCLPGPMFNLSVYIGTLVTRDITGAITAFLGLYLPCFMFILFILPHWQLYRQQKKVNAFINGMCCVSVGLILAAAVVLWQNSCVSNASVTIMQSVVFTLIIALCFYLLQIAKFQIISVLLIGELSYLLCIGFL